MKHAKKAVSDFNPDGMLAGFLIRQYTMPSGYLILVNQTTSPQTVTVSLSGLPYPAKAVGDYFDGEVVATVRQDSFLITLLMLGVGTGTTILRIAKQCSILLREITFLFHTVV